MKDRIRTIMDYARMSQQDFAARLGISAPSLSSIFNGRTNPTNNHVMAVHRAFPEINISWLLFGEGEMLNAESVPASDENAVTLPLEAEAQPVRARIEGATLAKSSTPSLFDAENATHPAPRYSQAPIGYGAVAGNVQTAKNVDRPLRKIKEIRVFYDDGTYESFAPTSK